MVQDDHKNKFDYVNLTVAPPSNNVVHEKSHSNAQRIDDHQVSFRPVPHIDCREEGVIKLAPHVFTEQHQKRRRIG